MGRRLVAAERAVLAEHVHPPGVRGTRLEHRAADQVDVAGHVQRELGRHHVRTEVGDLRGDLGGERQRAFLVRDGQPVAGLALERVVPWASISSASRRRFARSAASDAARVARTVVMMPPA